VVYVKRDWQWEVTNLNSRAREIVTRSVEFDLSSRRESIAPDRETELNGKFREGCKGFRL
jgi:hypothetical protein